MTKVVLAITKGPFAILPRFPPGNGGQSQIEAARGHRIFPATAQFQGVITAQIMIGATVGGDSLHRWEEGIPFGGMEVAARGIDSQRPPGSWSLLPSGKRQRQFKEESQSSPGQRLSGSGLAGEKFGKWRRFLFLCEGKFDPGCSREFSEGIGLICPIEVTEAARIALQVMFGFLMIGECFFKRGIPRRSCHIKSISFRVVKTKPQVGKR